MMEPPTRSLIKTISYSLLILVREQNLMRIHFLSEQIIYTSLGRLASAAATAADLIPELKSKLLLLFCYTEM